MSPSQFVCKPTTVLNKVCFVWFCLKRTPAALCQLGSRAQQWGQLLISPVSLKTRVLCISKRNCRFKDSRVHTNISYFNLG